MERKERRDYFVMGNFTGTGEYSWFCVIAGVITTDLFLQR
jgi:hypothetical protein